MLTDQVLGILEREVDQGNKAEKAYDLYVKDFIADSYTRIHKAFDDLNIQDTEALYNLKIMQSAVKQLEDQIFIDIESRALANKQLSDEADADVTH